MSKWSTLKLENLIHYISKYPCLYNPSVPEYKEHLVKTNAFKEIASFLNEEPAEVQSQWTKVRAKYTGERKKLAEKVKSGVPCTDVKSFWPLYEAMGTVGKFISTRDSKSRSTNLRPNVSMLSTNTFTPLSNVELPAHQAAPTEQLSLQHSVPQQDDASQTLQQINPLQSTPQVAVASTSSSEDNLISFEADGLMYMIDSFGDAHPMPCGNSNFFELSPFAVPSPFDNPVACSSKSGLEPVEDQRDAGGAVGNKSDETPRYAPVKKVSTSKKPKVTKRKLADDDDFGADFGNMLKVVRDASQSEESNHWVTYGKSFGMELSLLPRRKAMRIRQEMEKLLLDAEMEEEE